MKRWLEITALNANPHLPGGFTITSLVYNVATGRIDTIVPPALLRPD